MIRSDPTPTLKDYDKAKEAGDPEVASRLELVVVEKSNVMQAYMERNREGTDAQAKTTGGWTLTPIHPFCFLRCSG
jgi:hypothetical protein